MRKILIYSTAVLYFALAMTNFMPQTSTSITKIAVKIIQQPISLPELKEISDPPELKELRKNETSIKAQRDFMKEYKKATDVRWVISGNGLFAVYFTNAGIATRRYYTKKGVYEYMMRYYKEDKLPPKHPAPGKI